MKVTDGRLAGLRLVEPAVHGDSRGYFIESWNARGFAAAGIDATFVQDNHSRSARGVLRGLHYQIRRPQGKLVRVIAGEIFDVAVDLRRSSPTFGRWEGFRLSGERPAQLWIPVGFAHGFVVLSEFADVLYKTTDYYAPEHERGIRYDDPAIGIEWPLDAEPVLSARDARGAALGEAEIFD